MTAADAAPASSGPDEPSARPVPRLAYDIVRLGLAAVAGAVAASLTIIVMAAVRAGDLPWSAVVIGLFVFSAASSCFYIVHTLWVFARVDSATLGTWLHETTPRGRFARIGAEVSGTGPTIAVQWSVIAIAAVILFTVWPELLDQSITVGLSILVVATSWGVTVIAYAVHYARLDFLAGGLQYPDDGGRVFMDYVYLAVQVQTTFSTSDVSLTSTAARSIVTGHTIVSFAFNTVIIAMLITVLFIGH